MAEEYDGFIWRLKGDGFDTNQGATSIKIYDDPRTIINFTVWRSIDELKEFVYNSGHFHILSQKKKWFKKITNKTDHKYSLVLWWIKEKDPIPSVLDGKKKLELLNKIGSSNEAFSISSPHFPPNYKQSKL